MNDNIIITCDGIQKTYPKNTTYYEICKDLNKLDNVVALKSNNDLKDLGDKAVSNQTIEFIDYMSSIGNKVYENGLNFVLTYATKKVCGNEAYIKCEFSMGRGLFFTVNGIDIDESIAKEIKEKMQETIDLDIPFVKCNVVRKEAINYFKKHGRQDLEKSLKYISNSYINLYKLDNMYNYFYCKMPYSTGALKLFDLKYAQPNGLILQYPNKYRGNVIKEFESHDALFGSYKSDTDWLENIKISKLYELNQKISESKINDIISVAELFQNNSLLNIAMEIADKKDIKIVLIAGPSSSGKTTTSKKLSLYLKGLGLNPHPIALDDYFLDREECKKDENGKYDFESVDALDLKLFNEHLTKLLNNEEVSLPTYDFIEGKKTYGSKRLKMKEDDILVIEGLHGLNEILTSSIPRHNKYKIYISPLTSLNIDNCNRIRSTDIRLIRRIVRDNRTRGYTSSMTLNSWESVRDGEEKYIFPFKKDADVVFNTSLVYEMGVLRTYVEPLLFSVDNEDKNYSEAIRLLNILRLFLPIPSDSIPNDSIIREFIGGSRFE